jgi:hypothetical protein
MNTNISGGSNSSIPRPLFAEEFYSEQDEVTLKNLNQSFQQLTSTMELLNRESANVGVTVQ